MNLLIFVLFSLFLMIAATFTGRVLSDRKHVAAAMEKTDTDERISALEHAQAELSAQVSSLSQLFSKLQVYEDRLTDYEACLETFSNKVCSMYEEVNSVTSSDCRYEERLEELQETVDLFVKNCGCISCTDYADQIQHLSDIQRIQDACVSELGSSLDYLESMVCEYTSAVEDVLRRQYDDELYCFPGRRVQRKSSSGLHDYGELWLRLFNVRNHLSRILLHYNNSLSTVNPGLREEDIRICEQLSRKVGDLLDEHYRFEDEDKEEKPVSFEHEGSQQVFEELPF